jgi:hypothetical protein
MSGGSLASPRDHLARWSDEFDNEHERDDDDDENRNADRYGRRMRRSGVPTNKGARSVIFPYSYNAIARMQ